MINRHPCAALPHKARNVQVSDTTGDDSSNAARNKKNGLCKMPVTI